MIESREEFKDHHIELRLTNTSNFDINFFREKKKEEPKAIVYVFSYLYILLNIQFFIKICK